MKINIKNIVLKIFLVILAIIASIIKALLYIIFTVGSIIIFPFIALINLLFKKPISKNTLFDDDCRVNEIIAIIIEFPEELCEDILFWMHIKLIKDY